MIFLPWVLLYCMKETVKVIVKSGIGYVSKHKRKILPLGGIRKKGLKDSRVAKIARKRKQSRVVPCIMRHQMSYP